MLSGPVKGVTSVAVGDAGVQVNVDNRVPQVGGQVVFGVRSVIRRQVVPGVRSSGARSDNGTSDQVGVKVAIDVSEGLQFVPGLQPPGGTTFNSDTMIWDVGTVDSDLTTWLTLDVPVVVTPSPSLAELPLERRCLTAEVVEALPAYETDPRWELNDVFTLCLGQRPAVISDGEIALWWLHNCVGENRYPCGVADSIELFARVNCAEHVSQGIEQYCRGGIGDYEEYIDPRWVIVQIQDPGGRAKDAHPDSVVTDSGVVSWQTANVGDTGTPRAAHKHRNGVSLIESQEDFKNEASDWYSFGPFTVTKRESVPGHFKIRNAFDGSIWYDPMPTATQESFTDSSYLDSYEEFIEFERLGTYVMTFEAEATHSDGTKHSDEGTYTFHVGPISELEVWDARQSPVAPQGQQAYTILATNNGPDAAPDVEVTLRGVPQGAKPRLSDGAYRETTCQNGFCEAIWDLGELPLTGGRIARGVTEFPTLTLIAPAGSRAPNISASIANTQDYSVEIDGTTHSTNYFDYYEPNDTAVIVARAGAGDPSQPSVTTAQAYPQPPIAVLRWDPVERVNLWPVSHYEVWRSDASCALPTSLDTPPQVVVTEFVEELGPNGLDQPVCYHVRAVSDLGVPGTWSDAVRVAGVVASEPQLSVRGDRAPIEGGVATFTISAFPTPAIGETLTVAYTVTQQGDFAEAADLGAKEVNIGYDGEARIEVRTIDDEVNESSGSVTVTLNSGVGYKVSSARSASVRVMDDDRPLARFALDASSYSEDEAGPHDVVVVLEPAPSTELTLRYAVSGTATRNQDFTMMDYGSVTVTAEQAVVRIPVTINMDETSEPAETVELTLRAGSDYNVGENTHILTIQSNDQPEIAFSTASATVRESAGTYRAVIDVEPAPHEDLTIRYSIAAGPGAATSPVDYTIANSGTVTARRGTSRVEIPISIKDDSLNEATERIMLSLTGGTGYSLGSQRSFTLTITDNDGATVNFARRSAEVQENVGTYDVVVNLSRAPSSDMTIDYTVSGSATKGSGNDFTVLSNVTVPAGATSATIHVNVNNDSVNEGDETVILTLSGGTLYSVGDQNSFWLTILDDDNLPDTPVITVCYYRDESRCDSSDYNREVLEAGQLVPSMAIHGGPLAGEVKVKIQYVGGTAQPEDFTINGERPVKGKVYDAFEAYGEYRLSTKWTYDRVPEGNETVIFRLVNAPGYTVEGPTDFTVTIKDRN